MPNRRRSYNEGDKFNSLEFIKEIDLPIGEPRMAHFKCRCGNTCKKQINRVVGGLIKKCKECRGNEMSEIRRKYKVLDIFDDFSNKDAAYVLGLFFADGTVRRNERTMSVSLVEQDKQILEDISKIIQPSKPLHYCNINGGRNQFRMAISHKSIVGKFISAGCIPNKSLKLKYPTCKLNHRHFIRGYIDGDGHISRKALSMVGTLDFLEGVYSVFSSVLGKDLDCRCYNKSGQKSWDLQVSFLEDREKLLDWIYGDGGIMLERKYKSYLNGYKKL